MRLYKVKMDGDFGDADGRSFWASNKAQAQEYAASLKADCWDHASRGDPEIIVVEFEPTKAGLLRMLNEHADRG